MRHSPGILLASHIPCVVDSQSSVILAFYPQELGNALRFPSVFV